MSNREVLLIDGRNYSKDSITKLKIRLERKTNYKGHFPHKRALVKTRCWEWEGSLVGNGYGTIYFDSRPRQVHRIVYALAYGIDVAAHKVCHKCDNPKCKRPSHLFLGTQRDNVYDMIAKGRNCSGLRLSNAIKRTHAYCKGEANACAKITDNDAKMIRRQYATGTCTYADLAEVYSISKVAIGYIIRRKTYRHV